MYAKTARRGRTRGTPRVAEFVSQISRFVVQKRFGHFQTKSTNSFNYIAQEVRQLLDAREDEKGAGVFLFPEKRRQKYRAGVAQNFR